MDAAVRESTRGRLGKLRPFISITTDTFTTTKMIRIKVHGIIFTDLRMLSVHPERTWAVLFSNPIVETIPRNDKATNVHTVAVIPSPAVPLVPLPEHSSSGISELFLDAISDLNLLGYYGMFGKQSSSSLCNNTSLINNLLSIMLITKASSLLCSGFGLFRFASGRRLVEGSIGAFGSWWRWRWW